MWILSLSSLSVRGPLVDLLAAAPRAVAPADPEVRHARPLGEDGEVVALEVVQILAGVPLHADVVEGAPLVVRPLLVVPLRVIPEEVDGGGREDVTAGATPRVRPGVMAGVPLEAAVAPETVAEAQPRAVCPREAAEAMVVEGGAVMPPPLLIRRVSVGGAVAERGEAPEAPSGLAGEAPTHAQGLEVNAAVTAVQPPA